jgi:hypothetical protein
MSKLVAPLHTAAVGLGNLRFFRSQEEGPRQPWHSVEDLYRCMSMDRGLRRHFLAKLKADWKADIREVQTDTGQTTIAPHFMAQGVIDSMIAVGHAPASMDIAYARACAGAMDVLTLGMSPAEAMTYSVAAYRIENDIPGPHPILTEHRDATGRRIIR